MATKRRRPPIDYDRMTERQKKMKARAEAITASLALDQDAEFRRAQKALAATFEAALAEIEGTDFAMQLFTLFGCAATTVNAKRIANHPDCPDAARTKIEAHITENRKERTKSEIDPATNTKGDDIGSK